MHDLRAYRMVGQADKVTCAASGFRMEWAAVYMLDAVTGGGRSNDTQRAEETS